MAGRIPGMSVLAGRCWPSGRSLETPVLRHGYGDSGTVSLVDWGFRGGEC
jgi:hypothetical protein